MPISSHIPSQIVRVGWDMGRASSRRLTADLFTWGTRNGKSTMKMGSCTIDAATGTKSPDVQGGLTHNFDGYLDVGNSLRELWPTSADT